jgi:carboxymethylenebutenolidase
VRDDIAASVEVLRGIDGATDRGLFTVGFCFGGRHSWLAAAGGHGVDGAIGFYGFPAERFEELGPTELAGTLAAPILALQAGVDERITPEINAAFEQALSAAGVEHDLVVYDGAPHSFFDRRQEDFAEASDDAWRRVLAFIETHAR